MIEFLLVEVSQLSRQKNTSTPLYINTLHQDVQLPPDAIKMLKTINGVVTLYADGHKPLITRYSSLGEIEDKLPGDHFFRINRQSLLNRNAVSTIRRKPNRTLEVSLNVNDQPSLLVSRYKRSDFLKWLKNGK